MFNEELAKQQVAECLKRYCQRENIGITFAAEKLELPFTSFRRWCIGESVPHNENRKKIIELFPELEQVFADDAGEIGKTISMIKNELATNVELPRSSSNEIECAINIALVKKDVLSLSHILAWFIYQADTRERQQLRDVLGEDWQTFHKHVRALVSEKARDKSFEDGDIPALKGGF
ncbi:MAG: hypothetical protein Q8Q23_00755 [bacterium]|nr:hypothetical protein [bacterium]